MNPNVAVVQEGFNPSEGAIGDGKGLVEANLDGIEQRISKHSFKDTKPAIRSRPLEPIAGYISRGFG